jgi:hypothetical protein
MQNCPFLVKKYAKWLSGSVRVKNGHLFGPKKQSTNPIPNSKYILLTKLKCQIKKKNYHLFSNCNQYQQFNRIICKIVVIVPTESSQHFWRYSHKAVLGAARFFPIR